MIRENVTANKELTAELCKMKQGLESLAPDLVGSHATSGAEAERLEDYQPWELTHAAVRALVGRMGSGDLG